MTKSTTDATRTDDAAAGGEMTENPKADAPSNAQKDPDTWTTGDEPMTGAQGSYLQTLCEETGTEFDPKLSKAEASKQIDALQGQSKRLKTA